MDDVVWKVLSTVAKRGYIGATREDLFKEARGINFDELQQIIVDLEREGHITLEWMGVNKFVATITPGGSALVRMEYVKRIEDFRKRAEAEQTAADSGEPGADSAKGN